LGLVTFDWRQIIFLVYQADWRSSLQFSLPANAQRHIHKVAFIRDFQLCNFVKEPFRQRKVSDFMVSTQVLSLRVWQKATGNNPSSNAIAP